MDTPDDRKRIVENIPCVNLQAKHVKGSSILESRLSLLDALPKGLRCLELGVAAGGFSYEILTRMIPSKLDLVDLWNGPRYEKDLNIVQDKFKEQISTGIIKLHQSKSIEYLKNAEKNSYDFIYIDTDHSFSTTYNELCNAAHVINEDGFIAGHDYTVGNIVTPVVYGVIQAVNKFCVEYEFCLKYLTAEPDGYHSFCLGKIKNDK